jgi:hypothetical protein
LEWLAEEGGMKVSADPNEWAPWLYENKPAPARDLTYGEQWLAAKLSEKLSAQMTEVQQTVLAGGLSQEEYRYATGFLRGVSVAMAALKEVQAEANGTPADAKPQEKPLYQV